MAERATEQVNVVAVDFQKDSDAYQALTSLKELDGQHQLELRAAAVVVRDLDGHLTVKDQTGEREDFEGVGIGGLIGVLIGILGGPVGVLVGGATGALVGSLFDLEDDEDAESVLGDISKTVRIGHTALLAEVAEQSPEVVDSAMARLGGVVLRRPAYQVEAEIAAAEDAQRAARKAARKKLHEKRHAEHRQQVDAKMSELKAKLHHTHEHHTTTQHTTAQSA